MGSGVVWRFHWLSAGPRSSCMDETAPAVNSIVREIRAVGSPEVPLYVADFAILADVDRMANAILAGEPRLDGLVNNAGIIQDRRVVSADGHELTLQVNYLAGFLLARRLLPLLKRSALARIVDVASA